MGFPESVLAEGERVEGSLHPHPLTVLGPVVLGLVLAAIGIGVSVITPDDSRGNLIQVIAIAVVCLLALPLVLVPVLRWRTTHYVVTSHRVMVRRGILAKEGKDITLSKITDVSFQQSLLDRIIRSGTLRIESAGDSPDEVLHNIPRSDQVQQLLNRLIDADANRRAGRMLGQLEERLPDPGAGSPERPTLAEE